MRILLSLLIIASSGCALVGHLDQALLLNDYGNNKAAQKKLIKINDDHFDALVKAISTDDLKAYKTKADIRRGFGEPLQKKILEDTTERWLFRYAIFHQARLKVYLHFNGEQLIKVEQKSNGMMGEDS